MRSLLCGIFMLLLACNVVLADAKVSRYTLKNGLHLLVKEDHRAPVAIFQIWYHVGSADEPEGITGISHVLEHMMFKGSKNYPGQAFDQVVTNNGGVSNAFIGKDYTVYFEKFAKNKIPLSFKLEADRMQNATLPTTAFNKEIEVVKEERRMRVEDDPDSMLLERLLAAAFLSNPYHHPIVGWMGDLNQLTVQDVRAWYHQWYVPNNATIVIVGDVKPEAMQHLAEKYFAPIKAGALPKQKALAQQKPLGERSVSVSLRAKMPILMMAYNVPVIKTARRPEQPYALDVLQAILAGSDSSRLPRLLVRGQQIASIINVSYNDTARFNALFMLIAVPAAHHSDSVTKLRQAIQRQVQRLQTQPVSAIELGRVKTQVIANIIYVQDSITAQATQLGTLAYIGLPVDTYIKHIQEVTPAQVQAVAKLFLQPNRLTVAVLHPLSMSKVNPRKHSTASNSSAKGVN